MVTKAEIRAAIAAALAEPDPGRAEAALRALTGAPGLGPDTRLGLPRKLHSALLRHAKRRGDAVARLGLQALAVPDLEALFPPDAGARAAGVVAQAAEVPKVIHQIWVGGPPPAACAIWADYAARHGWAYHLWDEAALAAAGVTADPLWQAMAERRDWPGAVDVARYHVLAAGGVYLDCDWFPARPDLPPEAFLPARGLCALAEPAPRLAAGGSLLLANSLIAAPAGHPVFPRLRAALPEIARRLPGGPAWWVTGPLPFTLAARQGPVTVLDAGLVTATLPPGTGLATAEAAQGGEGWLIAWKGW